MNKDINHLIEILLSIKDKKEMENFLLGLLTPQELVELPTRVRIVEMLKAGIPQHEIAKKLGVGIATVTRGSAEIKKGHFVSLRSWRPSK